jgi:hypothetical protein
MAKFSSTINICGAHREITGGTYIHSYADWPRVYNKTGWKLVILRELLRASLIMG